MADVISETLANFSNRDWVEKNSVANTYQANDEADRYQRFWLRRHLLKVLIENAGSGVHEKAIEREPTVGHPRLFGTVISTRHWADGISGTELQATIRRLRVPEQDVFKDPIDLAVFGENGHTVDDPLAVVDFRTDGYFMSVAPGMRMSQPVFGQVVGVVNQLLGASGLDQYDRRTMSVLN